MALSHDIVCGCSPGENIKLFSFRRINNEGVIEFNGKICGTSWGK